MEAANQVAAYISKLAQQPIRDLLWEILIYIRCKHKIYVDLKGLTRISLKQILPKFERRLMGNVCGELVMANIGHRYEELHIKINSKSGLHYEIWIQHAN